MREILFRGKTKEGEWVEGFYFNTHFNHETNHLIKYETWDEGFGTNEVISETVGQYTDLTDKNGTKIFEGDILKSDNGDISVVEYWNGAFCQYFKCHGRHTECIYNSVSEVIGNIHDNKELI